MICFLSKQRFKIYYPHCHSSYIATLPNNTLILLQELNEFYNQQKADKILIHTGKFILTIFLAKKYVPLGVRRTVHTLFVVSFFLSKFKCLIRCGEGVKSLFPNPRPHMGHVAQVFHKSGLIFLFWKSEGLKVPEYISTKL